MFPREGRGPRYGGEIAGRHIQRWFDIDIDLTWYRLCRCPPSVDCECEAAEVALTRAAEARIAEAALY